MSRPSPEDVIGRILNDNPLIRFSVYTHMQVKFLVQMCHEVRGILDATITRGVPASESPIVDAKRIEHAYHLFWLWVLGAYEVTRTMDQARDCFEPMFAQEVHALKERLAVLRIPFAKQEYSKENRPADNELSIYAFDFDSHDLLFDVRSTSLSMRALFSKFESVMARVTLADVTGDHRQSQSYRKGHKPSIAL